MFARIGEEMFYRPQQEGTKMTAAWIDSGDSVPCE
jgi:hypothetical protein